MKHRLPPLDCLKAFEAAARHLSFSLAADELCITKGAISYQIRKLEDHIQSQLFKRSIRQVYLTDAGQELLKTTQFLFEEIDKTLARLKGDEEITISIAATTYVTVRWLSPRIASFMEEHPDVSVLFQHSVNSADFKLQDVDLAVRWSHCEGNIDRNRLREIPMPMFPTCSPALMKRLNVPVAQCPLPKRELLHAPFRDIPLLCEERYLDLWQAWFDPSGELLNNPRRIINDANVRVQAAIDGQGMILADELMQNELNNNMLIMPFAGELNGFGYALMYSPMRTTNKKSMALREWLMRD